MKDQLTDRDWQDLSAYLDGQLSSRERARLEEKIASRKDMQTGLEELRRVRIILRSQPRLRAPRNFTLGPEFTKQRVGRRPFRQLSPAFGLVSALASALFILVVVGESIFGTARPAVAPLQTDIQAKSAQVEMAASPTELSLQQAPELPAEQKAAPEATDQSLQAQDTRQAGGETPLTLVTPEVGMLEYPAPMAREYDTGAYPPPAMPSPPALAAQQAQQPLPEPTQTALPASEVAAAAEQTLEQPTSASETEIGQPRSSFWNTWRFIQFVLLLLAIGSGALAFSWRLKRF